MGYPPTSGSRGAAGGARGRVRDPTNPGHWIEERWPLTSVAPIASLKGYSGASVLSLGERFHRALGRLLLGAEQAPLLHHFEQPLHVLPRQRGTA